MNKLESLLYQTDFSKNTDLKSRLAGQLFNEKKSDKIVSFPFRALSDDDMTLVNAAQGLPSKAIDPEKTPKQ